MDATMTEARPQSKKEQQWQQAVDQVRQIEKKDPHGLKIDPKIKNTVIGLNAFGINTIMSCEGHTGHGRAYPYVAISAPEAMQYSHDAEIAYVLRRHDDHDRLRIKATEINTKLLVKLEGHLQEFYSSRHTGDNTKLVAEISNSSHAVSLRSQGVEIQKNADPDEKSANLAAFQGEMEDFGKFLEEKFFS